MTDLKVKEIKKIEYERPPIRRGYANQTLYVNLSDSTIASKPVSEKMKQTFTGGKGFDLWLLWNAVNSRTRWNSPENALCIACGPLGGTPTYPGSGKSIVSAISPTTGSAMDSNVGGFFGPYLKFSGFDALEIQGKTNVPTVIFVDGITRQVQLLEVSGLPEGAHEISEVLTEYFGQGKPRNISDYPAEMDALNATRARSSTWTHSTYICAAQTLTGHS